MRKKVSKTEHKFSSSFSMNGLSTELNFNLSSSIQFSHLTSLNPFQFIVITIRNTEWWKWELKEEGRAWK